MHIGRKSMCNGSHMGRKKELDMTQKPFMNMTEADMKFGYFVIGQGVKYCKRHLGAPEQFLRLMDIVQEEFKEAGIELVYYCGFPDQYVLIVKIRDTQEMMAAMENISYEFARRFNQGTKRKGNPLTPQILYHPILTSRMMYDMIRDIYDDTEYNNPGWLPFGGGSELLYKDDGYIDREALEQATGIPAMGWREMMKQPKCCTTPPNLPVSYDREAGYFLD